MILAVISFLFIGIIVNNLKFNAPMKYNNSNMDVIKEYSFDSLIDDEPCKVRVNLSLTGKAVAIHQEYVYNRSNEKELKYQKHSN